MALYSLFQPITPGKLTVLNRFVMAPMLRDATRRKSGLPAMLTGPDDLEARARKRLPHFMFEYIAGGSYDEVTLCANRAALARVRLRQRVMRNVPIDS